jgi:hypothetical protein
MEDDKRKYLSEIVGLPLTMVLVHSDHKPREQDAGSDPESGKSKEQSEKEAAVLRLIEHLNRKP